MTLDQLINAYKAVHDGVAPDTATQARLQYFVTLSDHQPSDAAAMSFIVNSADNTTALAALSYQFFTGKAPTKAGLDYLVNSPANPSDLNDSYYNGFNIENRYINFAANLGVQGEGAATFANKYGAMSFADYVAAIYQTIIGSSYAAAAGIDATKAIADIISRKDAILATAQGSGMIAPNATAAQIDIALKAATAGYLLGEAIKADVGVYASAANNFMVAVATGTATYGADLTTTYAKPAGVLGAGGGSAVSPGFNFPAPTPPTDGTPTTSQPVSHSFVLTTGADIPIGEGAADTFNGTIGGGGATLNATDVLNGAGGSDTLVLDSTAAAFQFDPTKITNIETLRVKAQTQDLVLDINGTGFTELNNNGSSQALTFNNVTPTATLSINNTTFDTTFSTPNTGLLGNADSVTLKLEAVTGAASVKISPDVAHANEYETLNIVSNGAGVNSITLGTDTTQTTLATINVSGAGGLTLAFAGGGDTTATTVTTIDAHALTGALTVTGADTIANTIIGGSGADVISLGAQGANAQSGADVITLNGGADTVSFVGNAAGGTGGATVLTTFAKVTDFAVAEDKIAVSANNADFSLLGNGGLKKAGGTDMGAGDTMVVQTVAKDAATAVATAGVTLIKLSTDVAFTTDIKGTFAAALGTASVTGLGSDSNHLVSIFDSTHGQMILAVVNVGANAGGDDNLFANDFTDASVAVVGVFNMTSGAYAAFGAGNLAAF